MKQYLLDTNILLRAADRSSVSHGVANDAVTNIMLNGDECFVTSQVLVEFWVVATRPLDVNGLGWDTSQADYYITAILDSFKLLVETAEVFNNWFRLVRDYHIKGKRTHDVRILGVMQAHNVPYLLTFNPKDFISIPNITIVHP
jgi:predicted nucleic acid-binding protein